MVGAEKLMLEMNLSYPPSVNHYYRKWAEGKTVRVAVGAAGSRYRAEVYRYRLETLKNPRILKCRLAVEVELWRPDRRKKGYDIDNFLKCLFDAITYANIWEDDEQVDCLLVHKMGVEAPGKIRVTMREI
jgi:crossover junction endodeoxyribonuclease RusA